jgi:HEAT repeat protein
MARFDRHRLDELGQHRLRLLLDSSDPTELAWACQISRLVRWVTPSAMLLLLSHAAPRVRQEAVDSLGRVAGVGVQPKVALLLEDDDEGVRQAAALCIQRITGKAPRW